MFIIRKELSVLDVECIMLKLDKFNSTYPNATQAQKEHHLAKTLKEFGVRVHYNAVSYKYGCIPAPRWNQCYQPTNDVTTSPPTDE